MLHLIPQASPDQLYPLPSSAGEPGKVTDLMTKALVGIPGKEVTMITVDYPPGATDPVHRHNASTFVYVLEGTVVMQMEGEKAVTLHPGDTFYEDPKWHPPGRSQRQRYEAGKILGVPCQGQGRADSRAGHEIMLPHRAQNL